MQAWGYGIYVLVWPALTFIIMALICGATIRDFRRAKRDNRRVV